MSFPVISGITFGQVNETSSANVGGNALGLIGQTPDGARFRWCKNSTVGVLSAFELTQSAAVNSSNDAALDIVGGTDTGVFTVTVITQKATSADEYKDGWLVVDTGPGEGRYRVVGNTAASSGANITVTLDETSPLKEALSSGTTKVGLWPNTYKDVIVCPTTLTGKPTGVPQVDVPVSHYFWAQVYGEGMANCDNAPAVNTILVPSGSSAGSLESVAALTSANNSVAKINQITVAHGFSAGAGADKINKVFFELE